MKEAFKYKLALTLIEGIGDINAKKLIAYCGGAEAVFKERKEVLKKIRIPGIRKKLLDSISGDVLISKAEKEMEFIQKNNIQPIYFLDDNYPRRLKYCDDSPVILYFKGNADLNSTKVISIVGTRNATDYGKKVCEQLIADLAAHDVLVVSGLAYGIDICAHRAALENNLPTVGVLAHGLQRLYPDVHRKTAAEMVKQGGLLTEFSSKEKFHPANFPARNRVVAGIADATLVVESAKKGGSLITAEIANSYNRDVFAIPGNLNKKFSEGCNKLIKTNKAALIESVEDIEYLMGWEKVEEKRTVQKQLFVNLTPKEEKLVNVLKTNGKTAIDLLCLKAKMSTSEAATLLLNLEFNGVVRSHPGKIYELN